MKDISKALSKILAKYPLQFKPRCTSPDAEKKLLTHINSGFSEAIWSTPEGFEIKAKTDVVIEVSFAEMELECGPIAKILADFFKDFPVIATIEKAVDKILELADMKALEATLQDIKKVAIKIRDQAQRIKNLDISALGKHHHRHRHLLDANGKLAYQPHELVRLSNGDIIPRKLLQIDHLHERAEVDVMAALKANMETHWRRRKLVQNPLSVISFKKLVAKLEFKFSTEWKLEEGDQDLVFEKDLFEELGGTPIRIDGGSHSLLRDWRGVPSWT